MTSIFRRKGRKGYTVEYRDPATLRLRQRKFDTRTDARDFSDHIRAQLRLADGLEVDYRFEAFAKRWLQDTATVVRPGTVRLYASVVRKHLVPAFGRLHLREITPRHIRDLIVDLRGRLSKNTVATVRATLHACLQSAVEGQVLRVNPAAIIGRSKLTRLATTAGEARGKVRAMTADQAQRFLAFAPAVAPRHAMMFRVMLATGLRTGEAIGLQPQDVDYKACRIRLERAISPRGDIHPTKTNAAGEWEYVDIPAALADELREWRVLEEAEMHATGRSAPRWLFPARNGSHMDREGTAAAFRRILVEAKLPDHFTPHSLRHTYATLQLVAGESVYYVSRQLRHADIRITVRTYGSWLPAGDRAVADRFYERVLAVRPESETST